MTQHCTACGFSYDFAAMAALTSLDAEREWPFGREMLEILRGRSIERMKDIARHRCRELAGTCEGVK